ncbi:hypothetical protein NHP21005_07180 [Helicobacter sp. NHP21005]|nr:hypothetical protein NHP21005_07180 [Helicobacter sp. NHP21005]
MARVKNATKDLPRKKPSLVRRGVRNSKTKSIKFHQIIYKFFIGLSLPKNTLKLAKITAMFALTHKIELQPNNKAQTHFSKINGATITKGR